MDKGSLTQNRRDNRRDIRRKNEIITGKYNTSKPLMKVTR